MIAVEIHVRMVELVKMVSTLLHANVLLDMMDTIVKTTSMTVMETFVGMVELEVNAYSCLCPAGYTGDNCETNIDECALVSCLNGGSCEDGINDYTCHCVAGYTGKDCEMNIDDCAANLCQNGAACLDGIENFTCTCVLGTLEITVRPTLTILHQFHVNMVELVKTMITLTHVSVFRDIMGTSVRTILMNALQVHV